MRRVNIVIFILHKVIYRFSVISNKISKTFFTNQEINL